MPPAAVVLQNCNNNNNGHAKPMAVPPVLQKPMMATVAAPDAFARDAMIAWYRGEFTAANAIIDELCSHLRQLDGAGHYESAFAAIHRRRLNWIPVLHMQTFYQIADVTKELEKVAARRREESEKVAIGEEEVNLEKCDGNGGDEVFDEDLSREDTPESEITDTGSQEMQPTPENIITFSSEEECAVRRSQIKMSKSFVAKEPVRGHLVNVVKGLKLYENVFTDHELSKLNDLANELRVAGQNGDLSGETFILYNQQTKGNKRELIQFGVPIFERIKEDTPDQSQQSYNIEPIPTLIQGVISHLIQLHLIPEYKKPTSCIINFFDEGEYSHPFLKPPHLEQPLSTLVLSESKMAFGRALACDGEGNYKGSLMLSLKEGSLIVMRGNSSDTARHAMCCSQNKRVSITFFKVRNETERSHLQDATPNKAIALWQSAAASPYTVPNNYQQMNMVSGWTIPRPSVVMLSPVRPMIMAPRTLPRDGTGVFLPGTGRPRRPAKQLPPRAQRRRFFSLLSSADTHKAETTSSSDSGSNIC